MAQKLKKLEKIETKVPTPELLQNYNENDADNDESEFQDASQDQSDRAITDEDGAPEDLANVFGEEDNLPEQGDIKSEDDGEDIDGIHLAKNDEDIDKELAASNKDLHPQEQNIELDRQPASEQSKTNPKSNYYSDLMGRFKAAQKQSDLNRNLNDMGKYAYAAGTSFQGVEKNPLIVKAMEEEGQRADLPIQRFEQQLQVQGQDPNSPAAQAMRSALSNTLGIDPSKLESLNGDQMEKLSKSMGTIVNNKVKAAATALNAQTNVKKADILQQGLTAKQPLIESQINKNNASSDYLKKRPDLDKAKLQMMKDSKEAATEMKSQKQQADTLNKTKQILESARGNPAVAQAEKDIYAASKANSLANLYGDPNKLSQPQVTMLATEVSKIASGGVPTMHELDAITPGTLNGKLSRVYSQLVNRPTPAHAAEFIKQYQDYANALTKDAQKVIKDKYGRVIESAKGGLGDDNYAVLQNNYIKRFDIPDEEQKEEKQQSIPKLSDEDKQAVDWANANKSDPRAAQILKLHGM